MLAVLTLIAQLAASSAAGPADLAFMVGSWEGAQGQLRLEERWTDARGGLMLGLALSGAAAQWRLHRGQQPPPPQRLG